MLVQNEKFFLRALNARVVFFGITPQVTGVERQVTSGRRGDTKMRFDDLKGCPSSLPLAAPPFVGAVWSMNDAEPARRRRDWGELEES